MRRFSFNSKTQRLCVLALMSAFALIIFTIEAQIPLPIAVPGLKLGLSNVITLYMLCTFSPLDALAVLAVRIMLGSIFAGQAVSFFYSLCGGVLAYIAMAVFLRLSRFQNVWFAGVLGAVLHGVGQLCAAAVLYRSAYVFTYLAVLTLFSVFTGLLTGITAQLLAIRNSSNNKEK